jgi:hypothetical protein
MFAITTKTERILHPRKERPKVACTIAMIWLPGVAPGPEDRRKAVHCQM